MSISIDKKLGNLILTEYQNTYPDIVSNKPLIPNINERFDEIIAKAMGDLFYDYTSITATAIIAGPIITNVTSITLMFSIIPDSNHPAVATAINNAKAALNIQQGFGDDFLNIFVNAFRQFLNQINTLDITNLETTPTTSGSAYADLSLQNRSSLENAIISYFISLGFTKYDSTGNPTGELPKFMQTLVTEIINIYEAIISGSEAYMTVTGTTTSATSSSTCKGPVIYP